MATPDAHTDVNRLYISSYDALHSKAIDQVIPDDWNDRPPLFMGRDDDQLLKGMVRRGIPEALKCAVWLSNVVKSCHPHQPPEYSEEYRTLGKVRALDYAWDSVLAQVFTTKEEQLDAVPPTFGADLTQLLQHHSIDIPPKGQKSLTLVLCALEHVVGLDFCPLLPALATLSLHYMSESYVFCMLREMLTLGSAFFLPTSPLEHYAYGKAFADVLQRLHPQTAAAMQENGSLQNPDPIFRYFFLPILPLRHVLRIMDIYTLEGAKVLFRFGVALLCLFKKDLKEMELNTADKWWSALRDYTHAPTFRIEVLVKKAYGYHGSRQRKRIRFPRRHILARIIRLEQERAPDLLFQATPPPRPVGLVSRSGGELPKPTHIRAHVASWLPPSLRLTKLDLIYSTDVHGRTLERFYHHVGGTKHTLTFCQVLDGKGTIVGMFASHAWHVAPRAYGDGECFLFRAHPDAACYPWKPTDVNDLQDEDEEEQRQHRALMEQFMVSTPDYISMGGNTDGGTGLRLNEDLTQGESASAAGFGNEPLASTGLFQVGLVEVYRLVRQVDGKGVDGEDRAW